VNKQNYTHEVISSTHRFNLSPLTVEAPFELVKRFGFQSGREVNKFLDLPAIARSENGIAYLTEYANAFLSFDLFDLVDFRTHSLFMGTLAECQTLSQKESLTYDYYHKNVKPKPPQPQTEQQRGYRCTICGYVYEGEPLPNDFICPICKHGAADFVKL
jgi:flavin reductase (DIM6/NTAB) family NADH-FMN oxidoreductase RutF/rubredoxin